MGGLFKSIELEPTLKTFDYETILKYELDHIAEIVSNRVDDGIKFSMSLGLELNLPSNTDERSSIKEVITFSGSCTATIIIEGVDVKDVIEYHLNSILCEVDEYVEYRIKCRVENIRNIMLLIVKYNPSSKNNSEEDNYEEEEEHYSQEY